jgi:hypothetical protein
MPGWHNLHRRSAPRRHNAEPGTPRVDHDAGTYLPARRAHTGDAAAFGEDLLGWCIGHQRGTQPRAGPGVAEGNLHRFPQESGLIPKPVALSAQSSALA